MLNRCKRYSATVSSGIRPSFIPAATVSAWISFHSHRTDTERCLERKHGDKCLNLESPGHHIGPDARTPPSHGPFLCLVFFAIQDYPGLTAINVDVAPGRHESATIALWTVALRNKSRPHPRPFKPDFRFHTHTSKPTLTPFPHLPPLSPRTEPSPLGHHTRIQADRRVSVRFQSVCVYVLVSRTSERLCLSISYDIGCLMLFDLLVPFVSVSLAQADYPRSV